MIRTRSSSRLRCLLWNRLVTTSTKSPITPCRASILRITAVTGRRLTYLGIGPSAFSTVGMSRWQNISITAATPIESYQVESAVESHEGLSPAIKCPEHIALALRTDAGVSGNVSFAVKSLQTKTVCRSGAATGAAGESSFSLNAGKSLADSVAHNLINADASRYCCQTNHSAARAAGRTSHCAAKRCCSRNPATVSASHTSRYRGELPREKKNGPTHPSRRPNREVGICRSSVEMFAEHLYVDHRLVDAAELNLPEQALDSVDDLEMSE